MTPENSDRTLALKMTLGGVDVELEDTIGLAEFLVLCGDALFQLGTVPADRSQLLEDFHQRTLVDATLMAAVDSLKTEAEDPLVAQQWLQKWQATIESDWEPAERMTPDDQALSCGTTWNTLGFGLDLPDSVTGLNFAAKLYDRATKGPAPSQEISRKLGNTLNVLGTHYMEAAASIDTSISQENVNTEKVC